jgi:hypothetical protein
MDNTIEDHLSLFRRVAAVDYNMSLRSLMRLNIVLQFIVTEFLDVSRHIPSKFSFWAGYPLLIMFHSNDRKVWFDDERIFSDQSHI